MDVADAWVETVRDLKDAVDEPFDVETVCRVILRYVRRSRIREVVKFKQRLGVEYEAFFSTLAIYDENIVNYIVNDDPFWTATTNLIGR